MARITVKLTPKGGRDAIEGVRDGVILARVAAPATEGAANEALVRLIAKRAGVAPSKVRIVGGAASRTKILDVEGATVGQIVGKLGC